MECQNPCRLSLAFIIHWRVVYNFHDEGGGNYLFYLNWLTWLKMFCEFRDSDCCTDGWLGVNVGWTIFKEERGIEGVVVCPRQSYPKIQPKNVRINYCDNRSVFLSILKQSSTYTEFVVFLMSLCDPYEIVSWGVGLYHTKHLWSLLKTTNSAWYLAIIQWIYLPEFTLAW